MANEVDRGTALRRQAEDVLDRLKGLPDDATLQEGKALAKQLRDEREFVTLTNVAEAVVRQAPDDATTRKYYAQALIETGHAVVAVDVLRNLLTDHGESTEAYGLIGRANKQIFFDAGDKTSVAAREALRHAITAYRAPFDADTAKNYWHGVNLLALVIAARRIGLDFASDLEPRALATRLIETLGRIPSDERDLWYYATLAEAYLALRDWPRVEQNLQLYVNGEGINAFALGSTLRQFTEVWNLDADVQRGRPLLDILRARLMALPSATFQLAPTEVQRLVEASPPAGQLEAILGTEGPATYQWMQNGMARALSVGSIRRKSDGGRHGTCFLLKPADLGLQAKKLGLRKDELVVLTNHHVVNPEGSGLAIRPNAAEAQFEAQKNAPRIALDVVLWSSPVERLDASILRLTKPPGRIKPLDAGADLPVLTQKPGVYIFGYPDGNELSMSFEDNQLLDHEGPPDGKPSLAGRVLLHYRTPTKPGNSGSPVFNKNWDVVALHHAGSKDGLGRLNGKEGTEPANEGIWIRSIIEAPK